MTTLHTAGITASYHGTRVLHGVDLEVPTGTTTAILGPSGCGKTTLLRVIAGFQVPDAGTVDLDGEQVVGPGVWTAPERRGIGYVAQEGNLFPHLSVGANIVFGLPRRERRGSDRVAELLELVGLSADLASRRPDQLSGGQQQRVALARALARRPRIVLLDEPFSSLDAGLRASTREAVAEALAHERVTVVLVTHDQAEALSFADQVAIMHEGRFTQVGSPAEVYGTPADRRSAQFLGDAVFLTGRSAGDQVECVLGTVPVHSGPGLDTGVPVEIMLRPEQVALHDSVEGRLAAEVLSTTYFGHDALVALRLLESDTIITSRVTGSDAPPVGSKVGLSVVGSARAFLP